MLAYPKTQETRCGQQHARWPREERKDMSTSFSNQAESRRRFLHMGVTGAVVGLLTGGLELALPPEVRAQSTLTPDAALAELMAGNQRFVTGRMTSTEHDLAILKEKTID